MTAKEGPSSFTHGQAKCTFYRFLQIQMTFTRLVTTGEKNRSVVPKLHS
jgi:hypothetical protein